MLEHKEQFSLTVKTVLQNFKSLNPIQAQPSSNANWPKCIKTKSSNPPDNQSHQPRFAS